MYKNENALFLYRYAGTLQKSAVDADQKSAQQLNKLAKKILAAADELEIAAAGVPDMEAMGGHVGILKRMLPGTEVIVYLTSIGTLKGTIRAVGRYDVVLMSHNGVELIVPKHAVSFWELVKGKPDMVEASQ